MTPTHAFTGTTDVDGDPSPFTGLRVQLVERFGMTHAGYDCLVRLDCTAEQLAERHNQASPGRRAYTADEVLQYYGGSTYSDDLDPAGLYIECCLADDLTPLPAGSSAP